MRMRTWIPNINLDTERLLVTGILEKLAEKGQDKEQERWAIVLGIWWVDVGGVERLSAG